MRITCIAVATLASMACLTQFATAQLPGGLGSGASGAASAAADAARAQAQVQQRVQAQIQQRVQTQVQANIQSNIQAQIQTRIQAEANRAAEIAMRASARAADRAQATVANAPNGVQLGVGVQANTGTDANVAGNRTRFNSSGQLSLQAGASLPPGVTQADVAIYDSIFGQFNPLRQAPSDRPTAAPATAPESGRQRDAANEKGTGNVASTNDQRPSHAGGLLNANLDFATRVHIAARQRRAEISQIRDHAIETGSAELLMQADQLETRLNAFAQAQTQLQSRLQTQAQGAATAGVNGAAQATSRANAQLGQGQPVARTAARAETSVTASGNSQ
ncbi:hypothetical protein Poly24_45110 [Rosistilla carotiformis]|uniref:Outer membrane efflux protein n=1 Tax=Rosistilla carotiformis TaxID=2528017 RepID=A0A518JZ07_9BACT|nr:hypothetical protein [Rosistilla carotiformis]QDV70780.1 hypothetical protein Poly24_45110 [Rosistilla carotiformis]